MESKITLTQLSEEQLRKLIEESIESSIPRLLKEHTPQVLNIEDEIMNSSDAARFLSISRVTLVDWLKKGIVPHRQEGRRLLFSKRELLDWVQRGGGQKKR